ncbi:LOW QUALITY PROTEIN: uncharacterized oxidoreductase YjmC-like [Bolinopsis microptera]|uniref:LOW QUALITY PROTEIN: uncharacterized oxidoreductase YjmC-like n=1 Tax=Bolinopsis microptera TaxID=2820187 RepID=UPI00307AA684
MAKIVTIREVRRFIIQSLRAAGGRDAQCEDLADVLVAADVRGHYSHGLNRLEMYCEDYQRGTSDKDASPVTEKETAATALVNGNNCLGATVGKYCMNLAIQKSKEIGVGVVTAKGSNHFGIAGFYGLMAKEAGLVGISLTNTSPLQVPTRGKVCTLGTNPISVIAPALGDDYFALDMATSAVAIGKVEVQRRKGEELPAGWGCDVNGIEAKDATDVIVDGGLFPLGGPEISGGYKGYGLALMVEMFVGILSGAHWGPHIRKWQAPNETRTADLGQFFMALNPAVFGEGFSERLQLLMDYHRALEPIAGVDSVLVPGDPERSHETLCRDSGGIPYHEALIRDMGIFAEKIKVDPMETLD